MALIPALSACIDSAEEVDVAQMPGSLAIMAGAGEVHVEFSYAQINYGSCFRLHSDVRASVGGVAIGIEEYGEAYEEDGITYCRYPEMRTTTPPEVDSATLVIADDSGQISCDLFNRLAPRRATRVDGGDWTLRAGQEVTVRWSPASDVSGYTFAPFVRPRGTEQNELMSFKRAGDLVTFTLPSSLSPGEYELRFSVNDDAVRQIDSCTRPATMYFSTEHVQPITIIL